MRRTPEQTKARREREAQRRAAHIRSLVDAMPTFRPDQIRDIKALLHSSPLRPKAVA